MPLLHVGNQSLAIFANQRVTNPDFERQYEQRHVLLATAEDVLVTSTPIDSAYLEYLDSLVGIPEIVVAGRHDQVCLAKNILGDPETLRQLRRAIDGREFILLPFMATPQIDQVAALLGIDVLGSSDLSEHFNRKSNFRDLAHELGLSVADGVGHMRDIACVKQAVCQLANGDGQVVVKGDLGTGGMENILLAEHASLDDLERQLEAWWVSGDNPLGEALVAERWYPKRCSPSIQLCVTNGSFTLGPVMTQILNSKSESEYLGCRFPARLPDEIVEALVTGAESLATVFQAKGLKGYIGFDTIVLPDGSVMWIEANMRLSATSFPYQFGQRFFGHNQFSMVGHSVKTRPSLTTDGVLGRLRPMLLKPGSTSGVIPYNLGLLAWNKLDLAAFASPQGDDLVQELIGEAEQRLNWR